MSNLVKTLLSRAPTGIEGLAVDHVPMPEPADGEVRIRVRACALSYPDLLMLEDRYQTKPRRPFAPGMEIAGDIDAVGGGDIGGLRPGDRVIASIPHGGMAERMLVPSTGCVPMPDTMLYEHGAIFFSSYGTAYHALTQRGALKAGETLLVIGAASGVGLSAVQLGKAMGARVIAAASSEDKLALAREHGADDTVLHPSGPLDAADAKAFTNALKAIAPKGLDVICDIVGGPFTEAALRAIAWEGRMLIIGFPAGIAALPMNLPLLKGCQVIGVFYGSFMQRDPQADASNVRELFRLYEAGAIAPFISGRYTLETAKDGFAQLAGRRAKGKLVVAID